jgi:hypothetical protein
MPGASTTEGAHKWHPPPDITDFNTPPDGFFGPLFVASLTGACGLNAFTLGIAFTGGQAGT